MIVIVIISVINIILISFGIIIVTIIITIIMTSNIFRNINLQNLRRASAFIDVMDRKVDRVRSDAILHFVFVFLFV